MASRGRKLGKSVHSAAQRALCDFMISARKRAGLTQQTLAARLSRPQSFIAKYETGERRIDVVEFIAICRAIPADSAAILAKVAKLV
jgi:transcriptional regulator with XRE-family HTH domain